MIIMVISSHLGSEEMILPASWCTLRLSVAGPAHRQRRPTAAPSTISSDGSLAKCGWPRGNVNSIKQRVPWLLPWLGYIASGVARPPEQAVLIRPLSA
jgi:hypothetical protein